MRVRPDHGGFTAILYPQWRVSPYFVLRLLLAEVILVGGMVGLATAGYLPPVLGNGGTALTLGAFLVLGLGLLEVRSFLPIEVGIDLPHFVWDGDRTLLKGIRCKGTGSVVQLTDLNGAVRYEQNHIHPQVVTWLVQTVEGYQAGLAHNPSK